MTTKDISIYLPLFSNEESIINFCSIKFLGSHETTLKINETYYTYIELINS